MTGKAIVLDANILIRAVLGKRVRALLVEHAATVMFFAPDVAYADARKYLPPLLIKRGLDPDAAVRVLDGIDSIVRPMGIELYEGLRHVAMQRIAARDVDDWPVPACALTLACPVWTEDTDFFGSGVATWTSDRIAQYFS